jgi:hypothetical protein
MTHPHTPVIAGITLTAGAKIAYSAKSGSKFTVYVSKTPIRDLGFGRGLYKMLEVWVNGRGNRYVYDRKTVII